VWAVARKFVTFREAILLANRVGIRGERNCYDKMEAVLDLEDGSSLHFESNYDEDYSEDTPGNGVQFPSVYLVPAKE
jgi:hypothetical protein